MRLILPTLSLLLSLAVASPTTLTKRWTCGGEAPAFSCEPASTCKNVMGWADCAINGLTTCGDPTPNQTTPVSPCQSASFTSCETKYC